MSHQIQTAASKPLRVKLTGAQRALLSAAYQREDRLVALGEHGGASRSKAVTTLLRRGLLAEVPARANQPFWRRDDENRLIGAVVTQAGLAALRIAGVVTAAPELERVEETTSQAPEKQANGSSSRPACRPGTKRALIIELLNRSDGASLDELVAATGWLPHTSRAALTGLRHKGFVLEKSLRPDGKSIYRIASAASEDRCAA
ncbi:MAG: uncharacterized protein JWM36_3052 [Hyphomicrobiales bacterium]|nr:uncharacterized protein [Hyphomicrobiales bacterium]